MNIDLYSYKAADRINIECSRCKTVYNRKIISIRTNVKKNGSFICHKCRNLDNVKRTAKKLKDRNAGRILSTDYVNESCDVCNSSVRLRRRTFVAHKKRTEGIFRCRSCVLKKAHKEGKFAKIYNENFTEKLSSASEEFWINNRKDWRNKLITPEFLQKMSESGKKAWDGESGERLRRRLQSPEYKSKLSEYSKMAWTDEFREKMKSISTPEKMSERGKLGWKKLRSSLSDDEIHDRFSEFGKKAWTDEFRLKMAEVRANMPKVSKPQELFYSILDDLGALYYREWNDKEDDPECKIGPYSFDCVIPTDGKLIAVDINGDYWHSLPKCISSDRAKATYIHKYFSDSYELKYVWEHELLNKDKVVESIKYWLNINHDKVDFDFSNIVIRPAKADEYKPLLSKYHYLPNAGRGGKPFGAFLNDELIAVCVFSPPVRQNIDLRGYDWYQVVELSRMCIHPKYQKKNFASWFVSRCMKRLDDKIKLIVAYSDTTFNHDGAMYKALNFVQDRVVPRDYWYSSRDGWVMHKRTLYGQAKSLRITEAEFARRFGYVKVWGREKLRFVYERCQT